VLAVFWYQNETISVPTAGVNSGEIKYWLGVVVQWKANPALPAWIAPVLVDLEVLELQLVSVH
jgi:uncharacterized membrane-anchored protein